MGSATTAALRAAKDYGVTISFDPNYREVLWQNKEDARAAIEKALPFADIIKSGKSRSQTALSDLAAYAKVGNAVACLCVQGRGGMNSMPDPESVEKLLNE